MLEFVNRSGSDCYKWDSEHAKGNLPLWVADMDFKAAPAIRTAMQKRLDHGVFGYGIVPQAYYNAVISWFSRRHQWNGIKREQLLCTIGVVPAIAAILRAIKDIHRAENKHLPLRVLTLTPAYNCFLSCISNLECELVDCHLNAVSKQDPEITTGKLEHFEVNWQDFEKKAAESDIFLLCNPHNPTGRVWTQQELSRMAQICNSHSLFVVSDEIHCEFTFPGHCYTPFAKVALNNNFCVCTSASKAFNIAGLQCANIFIPDIHVYAAVEHAVNIHEVCDLNPFGVVAAVAAYNESEDWINELNDYVLGNYNYLRRFIAEQLPALSLSDMEGTYLAWLNIKALNIPAEELCCKLSAEEQVLFNPSEMYGSEGYIRINLATSRDIVEQACGRLARLIHKII